MKHSKQSDYVLCILKGLMIIIAKWLANDTFKANQNIITMFYVAFTFNI